MPHNGPEAKTIVERQTKLLLVEDDEALREVLTMILTQAGYAVCAAKDGFSALRAIREQMPDLLLSDLFMPGMSGFELLHVVCVRFPAVRAVAMSGAFHGPDVPAGVDAEAFYEKGTYPEHLLQRLAQVQQHAKASPLTVVPERTVWVTRSGYDSNGEAYALLACPECLRAFAMPLGAADAGLRSTDCLHCRHRMGYRVVQGAGPATKPLYLMSLKRALPKRVAMRA